MQLRRPRDGSQVCWHCQKSCRVLVFRRSMERGATIQDSSANVKTVSEAAMPLPEQVYWADGRGTLRNADELMHK